VWSGVFTGLALLTRGSVGLGPFVALGIVLLAKLIRRQRSHVIALVTAMLVPLALYAYVNEARFGTLFKLPIDKQIATTIDPVRPKIFAGTHGSLFAAKFVPTDVVAMVRPNAISFTRVFPWVTFPARAHVFGQITFAAIDPASSLPASMPFLFVLALVGTVALFRRAYAPLRALAAGGLIGGIGVVTIPFISERYLSDFMPLVVVLAGAGMYAVLDKGPTLRRTTFAAFGTLAVLSLAINFGLALVYQRAYSPFTGDGERAAFVRFQRAAPGGSSMPVRTGASLPTPLAAGTLFALTNCAGVYWSDGAQWHPIERTNATGYFPLAMTIPAGRPGTATPMLEAGSDTVALRYLDHDHVQFVYGAAVGDAISRPNKPVRIDVTYDKNLGQLDVSVDGKSVLGYAYGLPGTSPHIVAPGATRLSAPPRFCQLLTKG
jgi:hypothetical protein